MNNTVKELPSSIYFDTLGCAKNLCDTSKMEDALVHAGYQITSDVETSSAIVLNTCAFIEAACQESIDTFFEYRNYYIDKPIIVVGCLPSRYGNDLKYALKEADAFLSCSEEEKLPEVLSSLGINSVSQIQIKSSSDLSYAYVKISEGCNNCCSYCMIPKIRGRYKSCSYDEIVKDCKKAINAGAKEVILVAQDCGAWGSDTGSNLAWLLNNLSDEFPHTMFRTLYIQPKAINQELLDIIASKNNISKYLDIPMQHCSSKLLKSMNRSGNAQTYLELIRSIRKTIPQCTLRTTFIVGFPGETDQDFDDLCSFVQEANFDYAGCFEYSNEEGSASSKLPNQISRDIKFSRTNVLREILDNISLNKINDKIGSEFLITIEGFEDDRYYGRAPFQAPDVDGVVYISEFCNTEKISIGDTLNVKIQDTEGYDLVGVVKDDKTN